MRDRLFSFRGIGSGEKYMVSMLLVQALFLGIFIGTFDISAHSLFLSVFDEKMLARAYVVSGFTGIILLSAYFFLQARIRSGNFVFYELSAVAVITIFLRLLPAISTANWTIFVVYIMLGPLNILAVMGLRAATGSILSTVKGNRLFSQVDTSLITGIILSCFSVPLLLYVGFRLQNILLLSSISVIVSAVLQGLGGRSRERSAEGISNQPVGMKSTLSVLNYFRQDRYTRILGIFIVLSVVSAFFIQYSFLAVTRVRFPSGEEIAEFLGIFTGCIMVLTLLGKLLLFSFLLKNYGLRVCLTISPVLLSLFTAVAIIVGLSMGYTMETAGGFMIFFIFLALLRFLSKSMDDSIESSSFRLLYQTIDEKIRFGVQSVMDSAVKEAAAFLAGLILAGAGILSFVRLIHFSWILFVIIIAWLYVAFRLYSAYRESVRKSLVSLKEDETAAGEMKQPVTCKSRFYGERAFRLDYFNLVAADYSLFEKTDNRHYFKKILDQSGSKPDINLLPLLKKLLGPRFDDDIRKQAVESIKKLEELSSVPKKDDERINSAKKILSDTRMPQTTEILRLLRDKSLESKRLAIYMIGKFRLSDMLPEVCECLNISGLESDTAAVLSAFGTSAEEELIRFYLISSGNITSSKTILRLLSRFPGHEGTAFLFSRLWSNSRQLKEVAIRCLLDCRFKPTDEDKERLNLLISDIIGIITWNLSAKRCLEKNNDDLLLHELNKELNRWSTFLTNILSIAYDPSTVTRIRKNLEFETVESVHYAHAIIDIVVDESIKAKIIYLLDAIPDDEKLRNLNRFFPVEITSYYRLLEEILNRDYNLLSLWTKACVLRYIPQISDSEMSESVVALLFSPENILQEEAVRLIARSDIKLYRSVYHRIPIGTRKHLDRIIDGETDTKEFLFDRVLFLASQFTGIIEEELLFLGRKLNFYSDTRSLITPLPDGYILWIPSSDNSKPEVHPVYSQTEADLFEKVNGSVKMPLYILSFRAIDEFLYLYPENSDIIMNYMEGLE